MKLDWEWEAQKSIRNSWGNNPVYYDYQFQYYLHLQPSVADGIP